MKFRCQSLRGSIELRDSRVEKAVSGANNQRTMFAQGVCQSNRGAEVICVKGNFARRGPKRIRYQSFGAESLQIVADTQTHGQPGCDSNRILREA